MSLCCSAPDKASKAIQLCRIQHTLHHGNFHRPTAIHHGILPHAQLGVRVGGAPLTRSSAHHFFSDRCVLPSAGLENIVSHKKHGKAMVIIGALCVLHETRFERLEADWYLSCVPLQHCALQLCLTGFVALYLGRGSEKHGLGLRVLCCRSQSLCENDIGTSLSDLVTCTFFKFLCQFPDDVHAPLHLFEHVRYRSFHCSIPQQHQ